MSVWFPSQEETHPIQRPFFEANKKKGPADGADNADASRMTIRGSLFSPINANATVIDAPILSHERPF